MDINTAYNLYSAINRLNDTLMRVELLLISNNDQLERFNGNIPKETKKTTIGDLFEQHEAKLNRTLTDDGDKFEMKKG